ncbi:MAG: hypothetical protein IJB29_00010 [Mailhella sp.]|nr:hypothetical protein [Mailhella sp.]
MSGWILFIFATAALAVLALLAYIRRARKSGDRVLVAHGLILLTGLVLACIGVAILKVISV